MTDLTEQWKKGELPSGYYYVKNEFDNIFPSDYSEDYDYIGDVVIKDFFTEVSEIKEVIAPVPSYEEWQLMQDDNKRLKHDVGNLGYKIKNQRKEIECQTAQNAQLKELLKECRHIIGIEKDFASCHFEEYKLVELLTKIDEVLK